MIRVSEEEVSASASVAVGKCFASVRHGGPGFLGSVHLNEGGPNFCCAFVCIQRGNNSAEEEEAEFAMDHTADNQGKRKQPPSRQVAPVEAEVEVMPGLHMRTLSERRSKARQDGRQGGRRAIEKARASESSRPSKKQKAVAVSSSSSEGEDTHAKDSGELMEMEQDWR